MATGLLLKQSNIMTTGTLADDEWTAILWYSEEDDHRCTKRYGPPTKPSNSRFPGYRACY